MSAFDPYAILGVSRDADTDTIRKAYRRAVKSTHPDAGGDPEAFRAVQRAYDVLTDTARRMRFDTTGEIDDKASENPDAPAFVIINQMLTGILAGQTDPTKSDLVAEMIAAIEMSVGEYRGRVEKLQGAADKLLKIRSRIRRKGEGDNVIAGMLDAQAHQIAMTIEVTQKEIAVRERAGELLADYSFDWDRMQAIGYFGSIHSNAFSFGLGR